MKAPSRFFLIVSLVLFGCLVFPARAQLVLDATKPYVYIEFDHQGERQIDGKHEQTLWLRLVNNSAVPIRIRTYSKGSNSADVGINYSVILTPEGALKYFHSQEAVPPGHMQDVSSSDTVAPGKSLMFTIPLRDVSEFWYIDTSFRFDLPRAMKGNDPTLHVAFTQSQVVQTQPH